MLILFALFSSVIGAAVPVDSRITDKMRAAATIPSLLIEEIVSDQVAGLSSEQIFTNCKNRGWNITKEWFGFILRSCVRHRQNICLRTVVDQEGYVCSVVSLEKWVFEFQHNRASIVEASQNRFPRKFSTITQAEVSELATVPAWFFQIIWMHFVASHGELNLPAVRGEIKKEMKRLGIQRAWNKPLTQHLDKKITVWHLNCVVPLLQGDNTWCREEAAGDDYVWNLSDKAQYKLLVEFSL